MGTITTRPSSPATLTALAERQMALITRAQAVEHGCSAAMIRRRVDVGRWQQVAPDVFLISGSPLTWPTRVLAVCLATGGIASHRTAAVLHGVDGFTAGPVEVSVGRTSRRSQVEIPGATVHRSGDIEYAQAQRIGPIPTTGPARLAVDLGAVVPAARYERAVDDLIARQLLTWDGAVSALLTHARRGRAGVGPLRTLLDARRGSDVPESVLERAFLRLLQSRGLPEPVQQHEIADARGFVARVDFAYPEARVAIELDGVRWHLNEEAFEGDHRKRARLLASGWVVLAFTWKMVMSEPGAVVTAVRAVLRI